MIPAEPTTLEDTLKELEQLPDKPTSDQTADKVKSESAKSEVAAGFKEKGVQSPTCPAAFLEVRILDDGPDPTRSRQIEDAVENKHVRLASIKLVPRKQKETEQADNAILSLDQLQTLNAEDIFISAYKEKYDNTPEDGVLNAFRMIVAELETNQ